MRSRAIEDELQPVFLIGMPGVGKTTVGLLLAQRIERRFVDLDTAVEEAAGATVRELFATEGEPAFRAREQAALFRVAEQGPVVVAVGGGTPCFGDNLDRMLAAGKVVHLTAARSALIERLAPTAHTRPLLAGQDLGAELDRLLAAREAFYARAPLQIDTTGLAPSLVALRVAEELAAWQ
jgi:shikimate kinase